VLGVGDAEGRVSGGQSGGGSPVLAVGVGAEWVQRVCRTGCGSGGERRSDAQSLFGSRAVDERERCHVVLLIGS
jgi:hypothetical protein